MRYIIIINLLIVTLNSKAQQPTQVTRQMPGEHLVGAYLEFGTSVVTSGLFYKYGLEAFHKNISVGTGVALPLLNPDIKDVRINIITLGAELIHWDAFSFIINYSPTLSFFQSHTQQMKSWGNEFSVYSGIYGAKWGVGSELKINHAYATYVNHTDDYQRFFDSGSKAKDGWYKNSAANIKLGLHVARRIENLDVKTSFGIRRTLKYEKYIIGPSGYAEISGSYRFQ